MMFCKLRSAIGMLTVAAGLVAMALPGPARAADDTPQTDGHLNVATLFYTLDATTWDALHWTWKELHDNLQLQALLRGDLSKGPRGTGDFAFDEQSYIPDQDLTGDLAESWEVKQDPLRIVFHLRKGVYWQSVPGVMERRELVADDVLATYKALEDSPRAQPGYWDFIDHWEAKDKYTVIAHLKYFHGNWPYKVGWGYYNGILSPEWIALDAKQRADWHNTVGTGPYRIKKIQTGRQQVYERNEKFWDSVTLDGKEYKLPLNEEVIYHIYKDPSSAMAALASGDLDIMERVSWQMVDRLKKAAPHLQMKKTLDFGTFMALRNDQKPFDDVRVRRAMNLAVDQKGILKSVLNGNGAVLNYPMDSRWAGFYTPLEELSPQGQALFEYKPEQAKKLLAQAGYPNGFTFTVQICSCSPYSRTLAPLLQAYYQAVGITMKVQAHEYASFRAKMGSKDQTGGYLMQTGGNPIQTIRKGFKSGERWNAARYSNPDVDKQIEAAIHEPDGEKRRQELNALNRYILEEAVPLVFLPSLGYYTAWQPWVKNYHGERSIGSARPNAIYARTWIDQDLKNKTLND